MADIGHGSFYVPSEVWSDLILKRLDGVALFFEDQIA